MLIQYFQCPHSRSLCHNLVVGDRFNDKRNSQKLDSIIDFLHKHKDWRQGKGNGLDNGLQQNVKVEKCWRQVYWRGNAARYFCAK